jgi:preprotein translocase subunit SecY
MMNREKPPSAQETFMQMAQAAGLRGRLLVTVGILVLIRMGIHIPIPNIDRISFAKAVAENSQILSFLDIFSGGGLSALGIFALGILPYINAMKVKLVGGSFLNTLAMFPLAGQFSKVYLLLVFG